MAFIEMISFAAIVFLSVYSYTEQMDNNENAWKWDFLKSVVGIFILMFTSEWSGVYNNNPIIKWVLLSFWMVSPLITFYFKTRNVSLKKSFN
jgi:uncharacterized membrane protein